MPKIDIHKINPEQGSSMPGDHSKPMQGRTQYALGAASGLSQFGANLVVLAPGAASALRHWHEKQDEFLVAISGALTLIDDAGETDMQPGDCAAFPAGDANGHHVVNHSDSDASFVVVGTHTEAEIGHYPDHDMKVTFDADGYVFTKENGAPLAANEGENS